MTRPVRLAVVSTHPIQYLSPLYAELAGREDVSVEVLYLTDFGAVASYDAGFGVQFAWDVDLLGGYASRFLENRARRPSPRLWGSDCPELRQLLTPERYDAVLIPGYKCRGYLQAIRAARRNGVPILLRGESAQHERRGAWKRAVRNASLRVLLQRVAGVVAIGERTRAHYRALGVGEERIFLSPYCVDNDRFLAQHAELAGERGRLRRLWGIPDDAVVAVLSGKLTEKKAPELALRAAARLRDPRLWLLFAGDGPRRDALEAEARALGFANLVVTGFLNQRQIGEAYAAGDLLLLPSRFGETWGLVVNEGMLFALPAIVSDQVGCAPDLVHRGATGWTFPSEDVGALAELLREAVGDPNRLRAMGSAAQHRVATEYSLGRAADGVVEACRYATARAGRRAA